MSQTVTFETAKRLKEAGFPQPNPEFGQVFYYGNKKPYLFQRVVHETSWEMLQTWIRYRDGYRITEWDMSEQRIVEAVFFAPTATDILLPGCVFQEDEKGLRIFRNWQDFEDGRAWIENKNHAEAKAEAWLKLDTK